MTAHAVFAVGQVPNDSVGIGFRHGEVLGRADLATDMGRDSTATSGGHGVKRTEGWKRAKESQKSGDLGLCYRQRVDAKRCNQIGASLVWGAILGRNWAILSMCKPCFWYGLLQTSWKFLGAGMELATNVLSANALKFWHSCPTAGASPKGAHSVVPKRVTQECQTNVSLKKVLQQCFRGVSSMTELQECPWRARLTWRVCLKESLKRMLQPDGVCSSISFQPVICIPVRGSYWTLDLFAYIYRHLPVHSLYTTSLGLTMMIFMRSFLNLVEKSTAQLRKIFFSWCR